MVTGKPANHAILSSYDGYYMQPSALTFQLRVAEIELLQCRRWMGAEFTKAIGSERLA